MKKRKLNVRVSFPKVTEVRIGSALRLAVSYYIKFNNAYFDIVSSEKLESILLNLPEAYKFETLANFSSFVISKFVDVDMLASEIKFDGAESINKKTEVYGENLIPLECLRYFNKVILRRFVSILLKNIEEETVKTHVMVIKREKYANLVCEKCQNQFELALKFITNLKNWLEYNMIVRIDNFYIDPETFDIVFPVRFSFLEKLIM